MDEQDPEEKHFIGDLLSELAAEWNFQDDDVFRSSSNDTSRHSEGSLRSTAPKPRQLEPQQQSNSIGLTAGSSFAQWPEPPPPYSPPTPHGWYAGKPVIAVDTSVPPPMLDNKQAAAAMAFMQQAGMHLPPGLPPMTMQQASAAQAAGFYSPFGAAAAAGGNSMHHHHMPHAQQPTESQLLQQYALHHDQLQQHMQNKAHKQQQQQESCGPQQQVALPKTGVSYSAAAARSQRAQSSSSVGAAIGQPSFAAPGGHSALEHTGGKDKSSWQLLSRHGSCTSCAKDSNTTGRRSANNTPPLQHASQPMTYNAVSHAAAPATNEFQKITGKRKAGKTQQPQQQQPPAPQLPAQQQPPPQQQQAKVARKYSAAEVLPVAGSDAQQDKAKVNTRFQALASETAESRARSSRAQAVLQADDDDPNDDNTGAQAMNKAASLRQRANKTTASSRAGARGSAGRKRGRGTGEQTPLQLVLGWLCVLLQQLLGYLSLAALWLKDLLTEVASALVDITAHGLRQLWAGVCERTELLYHYCSERLCAAALSARHPRLWLDKLFSRASWKFWANNHDTDDDSWGLDENIHLPNTGDEAMRRLLLCKGQDAYSILGLRADCTDDEIKKYYKRQAVLVHPDKNCSFGADEAFKILAAAFDMIGKPERRDQYNRANIHRSKEMKAFEQLMQQLRAKMDEALSTMQCDCGNKHHRYNTKRDPLLCRFCRRCNEMHCAKDNDIWAESRWLGFLWYYYACIDGVVYDITEWASCSKNPLKHMKANDHLIKYRLVSTKQQTPSSATGSAHSSRQDLPSEAEVDAWLQRVQRSTASGSAASLLLDTLGQPAPACPPQQQQQQQRERFSAPFGSQPSSSNDSMNTATASYRPPDRASTRKAGRRRKAK